MSRRGPLPGTFSSRVAVLVLVTLTGLVPAVGSEDGVETPPAPSGDGASQPPALAGVVWRLTHLHGVDPKALSDSSDAPGVSFARGRLQGFGGCNRWNGAYAVEGDRLAIGPLAGTMMACPEPAMSVDTALRKALTGTLWFRVQDGRLDLAPEEGGEPTIRFAAAPPTGLEGVTWAVTGYNNGRHAVVSPLVGTALTLAFDGGTVAGDSGCNRFRATFELDGDRLVVGEPAVTRKQCDEDVMAQERDFLAALSSATTWAVDGIGGPLLDLHRADGERVLHARPAEEPRGSRETPVRKTR